MSQRLIYVMDPMCSWCWGFASVIDAILEASPDLPIHFVAAGLRTGHRDLLDERTREVLAEHWDTVQRASSQAFVSPFDLPDTFIYDTEPACRALVVARELDPQHVWALVKAIQQALYTEGEEVARVALLMRLAEAAGYDRELFCRRFDAPESRAATEADVAWVQDLGIAGLPILLGQRDGQLALLTSGYQPADAVLPLLARWQAAGQS